MLFPHELMRSSAQELRSLQYHLAVFIKILHIHKLSVFIGLYFLHLAVNIVAPRYPVFDTGPVIHLGLQLPGRVIEFAYPVLLAVLEGLQAFLPAVPEKTDAVPLFNCG